VFGCFRLIWESGDVVDKKQTKYCSNKTIKKEKKKKNIFGEVSDCQLAELYLVGLQKNLKLAL